MTKREMIEAMLAGKTLVCNGAEAFYDEEECPPFRYRCSDGSSEDLSGAWDDDWCIKPESKKRPMTRDEILGFCAHNPRIIVRVDGSNPRLMGYWSFDSINEGIYEWATITPDGAIGEWRAFEKEVAE